MLKYFKQFFRFFRDARLFHFYAGNRGIISRPALKNGAPQRSAGA